MSKRWGWFALILGLLVLVACGGGKEPQSKIITLEVGKGQDLVKIVFDTSRAKLAKENGALVLTNAIVDFVIPFRGKKTTMTQSWVSGEVVVNRMELIPGPDDKSVVVIIRYTSKGTGGGQGNLGVSLVVGLGLDKQIVEDTDPLEFALPGNGKLAPSGDKLRVLSKYVKADLALASAQSKAYTMLAGAKKNDSYFVGFAVWDPTSEKSKTGAYFEFKSNTGATAWVMTGTDK